MAIHGKSHEIDAEEEVVICITERKTGTGD
jgi:hypothetical protein